jgi:hypothetical protein
LPDNALDAADGQPCFHRLSCRCAECVCIRLEEKFSAGDRNGDIPIAVGRRRVSPRIVASRATRAA